jgi:hypothetical protein
MRAFTTRSQNVPGLEKPEKASLGRFLQLYQLMQTCSTCKTLLAGWPLYVSQFFACLPSFTFESRAGGDEE